MGIHAVTPVIYLYLLEPDMEGNELRNMVREVADINTENGDSELQEEIFKEGGTVQSPECEDNVDREYTGLALLVDQMGDSVGFSNLKKCQLAQ